MGFTELHAHVIDIGSILKRGESADHRMVRYSTGYYPSDVGVEMVVWDIEDFRTSAELAEPRLSVELQKLANNIDLSLATKGSENGRRMMEIQRERDALNRPALRSDRENSIDEMNYVNNKSYDRNKNYK